MAEPAGALHGVRVLVVSNERVAARMAGPAIRSLNLARQLAARGARVTLAMPELPEAGAVDAPGVSLAAFGTPSARGFAQLARDHDVVVTQPQRVDVAWGLARTGVRVVYDLYVPSFVERIAQLQGEPGDRTLHERLLERDRREYAAAIQLGDAFICATERQRDHWLGALGQAGRLELDLLVRDPRADALCGVVAFGTPDEPPTTTEPSPLRGVLVPDDAIVALWTGGLWNWFDPVLVVEAFARARAAEPRLELVFMGMHHPEAAWEEQEASRAMRARAAELGLLEPGGGVTLLDEWVPYDERHRWLLDADVAVSAHHATLETRFSFRTRFLDQLWCGLPTVTTEGGELTDRMVAAGAAVAVADRDVDAWSSALLELARSDERRAEMSAAASRRAPQFAWSRTSEALVAIVAEQATLTSTAPRATRREIRLASYSLLLLRIRAQAKGVGSIAAALRGAAGR